MERLTLTNRFRNQTVPFEGKICIGLHRLCQERSTDISIPNYGCQTLPARRSFGQVEIFSFEILSTTHEKVL